MQNRFAKWVVDLDYTGGGGVLHSWRRSITLGGDFGWNSALTGEYARVAETTHETMGTQKAEVRNTKGECILDGFLDPGGAKHAGKSLIAQLLPPDKKRTRYDDSQRD